MSTLGTAPVLTVAHVGVSQAGLQKTQSWPFRRPVRAQPKGHHGVMFISCPVKMAPCGFDHQKSPRPILWLRGWDIALDS